MPRTKRSPVEVVNKMPRRKAYSSSKVKVIKVDELDKKLITLMQKDARRSSEALARQLDISPATVRRRVRNMVHKGVVRVAAIADPDKVGLSLAAIIAVKADNKEINSVFKAISARKEVESACTMTGQFDILAMTRFHSTDELSRFVQHDLADIEGIRNTETFICLDMRRGAIGSFSSAHSISPS